MTGGEVEIIVTWAATSAGISIVAVGWMREGLWPLKWNQPKQRKADESQARVNCAPGPRLGIDVAPIRPPLVDERIVDVIHDRLERARAIR